MQMSLATPSCWLCREAAMQVTSLPARSPSSIDSSACDDRRSHGQSSMHVIVMHAGIYCMNKGVPPTLETICNTRDLAKQRS